MHIHARAVYLLVLSVTETSVTNVGGHAFTHPYRSPFTITVDFCRSVMTLGTLEKPMTSFASVEEWQQSWLCSHLPSVMTTRWQTGPARPPRASHSVWTQAMVITRLGAWNGNHRSWCVQRYSQVSTCALQYTESVWVHLVPDIKGLHDPTSRQLPPPQSLSGWGY